MLDKSKSDGIVALIVKPIYGRGLSSKTFIECIQIFSIVYMGFDIRSRNTLFTYKEEHKLKISGKCC